MLNVADLLLYALKDLLCIPRPHPSLKTDLQLQTVYENSLNQNSCYCRNVRVKLNSVNKSFKQRIKDDSEIYV